MSNTEYTNWSQADTEAKKSSLANPKTIIGISLSYENRFEVFDIIENHKDVADAKYSIQATYLNGRQICLYPIGIKL